MREEARSSGSGDRAAIVMGPLLRVHMVPRQTLWRIGPGWAALAGALASGVPISDREMILKTIAVLLLAECIWGVLRQLIPAGRMSREMVAPPRLPYATQAGSLARLLGHLRAGELDSATAWQELLLAVLVGAALSGLLGLPVVVMSAAALIVIWLAWATARRGTTPACCLALLDVALPWALGLWVALRPRFDDFRALWPAAAVAVAFTLLQWGFHRFRTRPGAGMGILWLGQVAILVALIVAGQVWAAAIVGALFLPTVMWLTQRVFSPQGLAYSLPWWAAALLVSAVSLR